MTPAALRAALAVTLSVAADATMHDAVRLSIVQRRLSRLIDQVPDDDDVFTTL